MHINQNLHMSTKQSAAIFGQTFFCFNLDTICKKIVDQCLHCTSNFYRHRQTQALGESRLFGDVWTPNLCWCFDTMHLPDSHGFTHILVGVEAISSYVVLYPMRGVTVDQVIKVVHQHLTNFPHFKIARTDGGPEFGRKFTQFLATHSIVHTWTIPTRSQVLGQAEISIRITRSIINKIVDASSLNRHSWFKMLPFISNSLNKGQLAGAQGLTRSQLLFSPFVQQCGLPAEGLFMIQERLFKKIITNRQNLLLKRQNKFRTDNSMFEPGQLVFKLNEVFENVSFPKSKPTVKELFMIVFIPSKQVKGDTHHRVSQSAFKIWVRNLRTDKVSATWSSNLRLVRVTDLAYMDFDPFTYLGAQLKRLGSAEGNQDRGLFLLGGETTEGQDHSIVDTSGKDQTGGRPDSALTQKIVKKLIMKMRWEQGLKEWFINLKN